MNEKENQEGSDIDPCEYEEVAWAKELAATEHLTFLELTPRALENLNRNDRCRKPCSKLKLEPVEEILLIFDPENVKVVGDGFHDDILFLYDVIDPEHPNRRQVFSANKDASEIIDTHLRSGSNILRIQKIGTGEASRYKVDPV